MKFIVIGLLSLIVAGIYYFKDKKLKEDNNVVPMYSMTQLKANFILRVLFIFIGTVCLFFVFKILEYMFLSVSGL